MVLRVVLVPRVGCPELVKNRPGTLGVNCRNLSHDLSVVGVIAVIELWPVTSSSLAGTHLGRTSARVSVAALSSGRVVSSDVVNVLIVNDPGLLERIGEEIKPLSIAGEDPVSAELFHSSIRHLLRFFYLLRVQLDLGRVRGPAARGDNLLLLQLVGVQV